MPDRSRLHRSALSVPMAGLLLCTAAPLHAQAPPVIRDVEAGAIFNQREAMKRCRKVCAPPMRWNGQWRTTVPGRMSVCGCETPVVVAPPPPPPPQPVYVPGPPPPQPAGGCQWADGSDPNAPPTDGGRGVSDWSAHYNYAINPQQAAGIGELIAGRMTTLRGCVAPDAFARIYADVSVRIAYVGRWGAGWDDNGGPDAPAHDRGRALMRWRPHYDYAMSEPGAAGASGMVMHRLRHLQRRLPPDAFARLYADLSTLLATHARSS